MGDLAGKKGDPHNKGSRKINPWCGNPFIDPREIPPLRFCRGYPWVGQDKSPCRAPPEVGGPGLKPRGTGPRWCFSLFLSFFTTGETRAEDTARRSAADRQRRRIGLHAGSRRRRHGEEAEDTNRNARHSSRNGRTTADRRYTVQNGRERSANKCDVGQGGRVTTLRNARKSHTGKHDK